MKDEDKKLLNSVSGFWCSWEAEKLIQRLAVRLRDVLDELDLSNRALAVQTRGLAEATKERDEARNLNEQILQGLFKNRPSTTFSVAPRVPTGLLLDEPLEPSEGILPTSVEQPSPEAIAYGKTVVERLNARCNNFNGRLLVPGVFGNERFYCALEKGHYGMHQWAGTVKWWPTDDATELAENPPVPPETSR
jgi:hypothetical protein